MVSLSGIPKLRISSLEISKLLNGILVNRDPLPLKVKLDSMVVSVKRNAGLSKAYKSIALLDLRFNTFLPSLFFSNPIDALDC